LSAGRFPDELRPGDKRRPYTPFGVAGIIRDVRPDCCHTALRKK
jgi:hypothetical protein